MNKQVLKKVGLEIVFCLMQIAFSNVNILKKVYPVGFSFALVRLYFGTNIFYVVGEYIVSKIFLLFNLKWIVVIVFEIILLGLFYFANEYFKIKRKYLRVSVFAILSKMPELYICFAGGGGLLLQIANIFLAVLYSLYFIRLFMSLKNKALFFKFSRIDYLIFSVFTFTFFVGVFNFEIVSKYVYLFFIAFPIIMMCKIIQPEKSLMNAGIIGVAFCLISSNYEMFIFIFVVSCVLICVRDFRKYVYALVVLAVCSIFVYVFKFYDFLEIFSLFFAVFLFILLPERLLCKMSQAFDVDSMELITTENLKTKVEKTKEKLEMMSETLCQMQSNFKYLIVGKINREKAAVELSQDVINRCCKNCENYKICFLGNIQKKTFFDSLLYRSFLSGKVGFDDVTSTLQTYCNKTPIIVSEINQVADRFLAYENAMKSEDSSKLVISSELENFSNIFLNFSKLTKVDYKVNKKTSKAIKELLLKSLIDVKDVVVYENSDGVESVSIVASNKELLKSDIIKNIFKVTKVKMEIENIKHLEFSGISLASFVPAENFRLDFAVSTRAKENVNGDSTTVVKLSNNRYLIAITDGMGHGEQANRVSSMVVSLIESMFKIGLENELVVDSINKLLIPAGLDNFTTLDACVIDTKNAIANFIKMGSSVSLIKHKNQTEIVSSDSLPMGIVQNIKPTIIQKQIFVGDVILLASDGVVDSFESIELYKSFVNDSSIYNLKSYADSLIFDASYQNQSHPDDMTVIAVNLLKK